MNAITAGFNRVNALIEEVRQEVNANIENLKEELREQVRAELQAEFELVTEDLKARIDKLEVLIGVQAESRCAEESPIREPKKKAKGKKTREKLEYHIQENSYESHDIHMLDSFLLCSEFSRIKLNGATTMYCKHCKKDTPLRNWVYSIRARCLKNGLNAETIIPKTCDRMKAINEIANPINNRVYSKFRNPNLDNDEKKIWAVYRKNMFEKIGISIKPYRYTYI
jgi:hypothetical protein